MPAYSPVYHTTRCQYRYNYTARQLEKIGKKIVSRTIRNRRVPVVDLCVLASAGLKPELFDRAPGFWIDLFESNLKGEKNSNAL